MQHTHFKRLMEKTGILLLLPAAILFCMGLLESAWALAPQPNSSCFNLKNYGFTEGLVYCVQNSVSIAVNQYAAVMEITLLPYLGLSGAVAVAFFGFKMMNSNLQEPLKETMILTLRLMIGIFFYYNAINMYNDIVGAPFLGIGGIMNEAITWVTGFGPLGGVGGVGGVFNNLANCGLPALPPGGVEGLQIWESFDCMFQIILGAANPANNPTAWATSLLMVVGAAVLSSTLGLMVAGLGITLFIGALLLVFRALYLVLISYVCIGFMCIFAPLIAPLLFFESKYLTEKFKQWLGIIVSAIFQPIFVIAFLALAITVDDKLIEGTALDFPPILANGSPGCIPPTMPTATSSVTSAPAAGYGQDGSGVCSFTQLFYPGGGIPGQNGATVMKAFFNMMEMNGRFWSGMMVNGDQQGRGTAPGQFVDPNAYLNVAMTSTVPSQQRLAATAANFDFTGTMFKEFAPLKQTTLTFFTFIFINYAMLKLMELIPSMAAQMTIMSGVELASLMQLPFEGSIRGMMGGINDAMMNASSGRGLLSGNTRGVGGLVQAVKDAVPESIGAMVGKRPSVGN